MGDEPEHSKIIGPNTDSYNFFLMCVLKGGAKLTERVTGSLKAMELYQQYSKGYVQENNLSYYIEIYDWSVAAGIKAKEYFRMQNQTYQPTDLYYGYYRIGNSEAILQYIHELQNEGVHAAAPATVTYNTDWGVHKSCQKVQ